jgi:hypothetical protein
MPRVYSEQVLTGAAGEIIITDSPVYAAKALKFRIEDALKQAG